jgi:signal transduction histidine kinase
MFGCAVNAGLMLNLLVNNVMMQQPQQENQSKFREKRVKTKYFVEAIKDLARGLTFFHNQLTIRVSANHDVPKFMVLNVAGLVQICMNFLSNACKHQKRGLIQVQLSVNNGNLMVIVEDEGPGLSEEFVKAQMLFEAFKQDLSTLGVPGSGLGLFICKKTATEMGGKVGYRTREDGLSGAVFWVEVPFHTEGEVEMWSLTESGWNGLSSVMIERNSKTKVELFVVVVVHLLKLFRTMAVTTAAYLKK